MSVPPRRPECAGSTRPDGVQSSGRGGSCPALLASGAAHASFPHPVRLVPVLMLAAAMLASCSVSVHRNWCWASKSWTSDEPLHERCETIVECAADATTVSTELQVHGVSGELLVRLVDPGGVERLRQVVRTGASEATHVWPACVGTWRLLLEPADFVGSYSVTMSANDAPIVIQVRLLGGSGQ